MIEPGDAGYDEARQVWNAAFDRRPAAIAPCASVEDVRRALATDLPVTVRGGGHSIAGHAVADGAVMIDLAPLSAIAIDGEVVTAGGGARWGELVAATAPRGRAASGGFNPRVGVAGLTLGGGYGLLARLHGPACDNLAGADVVLAGGEVVRAEDDPDLLWALRGAGANFGVVTALRLALHPVPERFPHVAVAQRLEGGRDFLRGYRDFVAGLPDATTCYAGFRGAPPYFLAVAWHLGERSEAERLLRPLAALGKGQGTMTTYAAVHADGPTSFPTGMHNAWWSHFFGGFDDATLDAIAESALRARGHDLYVVLEHLGGAFARPAASCFAPRRAAFGLAIAAKWRPGDEAAAAALRGLGAELHAAVAPAATGVYVNYLGAEHTAADVATAYGEHLPRLRELKRRYDPDNRFRSNVSLA